MPLPLPVDDVLPELVEALRSSSSVVLHAPAGAGKTTRVPPALLEAGFADDGQILMLQPRRVAARASARRISSERGTRLGDETGYQVRFDEQVSSRTRIRIVTEGVLLRMLFEDPFLERLSVVVFDEFHERSLASDLALGMVRRIQQTVRSDLRIVVMSATLAAEPIAEYLGGCPIIRSQTRTFPVDVRYLRSTDPRPLPQQVLDAVQQMLERTPGDVLVFLPGVGEIRRTQKELETRLKNVAVMPLYGDLPAEQQDAVLSAGSQRRIVLATNVAETSVTVEGITAVIDSGLARVPAFDAQIGLDRLELRRCSKASADQRAGRAGRLSAGQCLRLWDERSHAQRPDFEEPEVRRVDLAGTVLQLWCWGERDVSAFPWFEAPRPAAVEQALIQLQRLGAITESQVTPLGERMARFPVAPRLGRLMLEGRTLGCARRTALLAALLSERDPFFRGESGPRDNPSRGVKSFSGSARAMPVARHRSRSDTLDRLSALEDFERQGTIETGFGTINMNAARFILKARDQFLSLLTRLRDDSDEDSYPDAAAGSMDADEAVLRALLAAYPDRLAKRRGPRDRRGLMVGGRGVKLDARSAVEEGDLFLCIDVDGGESEATVREASVVEREWLPMDRLQTRDELFFHPSQKRVAARRRTYWDDLPIDESTAPVTDAERCAEVLFQAAKAQWDAVFPKTDKDISSLLLRTRCLADWMPELNLPRFDELQLHEILQSLCRQCSSFDDLKKAPWLDYIRAALTPTQQQILQRETPERIEVPSGNRHRLVYEQGRPPVLAVRIQEVFGMLETPRVAAGRVPVLMHLLAPNMRPAQITDDLRSFWQNGYPLVRKELRARYPKHAWPDDPLQASPESRPRRKGS